MINIEKPNIIIQEGVTRLCCKVTINEDIKELYFETNDKYADFFCDDRVDAFVVALIPLALEKGMNIKSKTPISEKLYAQLSNYYIPTLGKYIYNNKVSLDMELINDSVNVGNAVGTGLSLGVDSFYTIASHQNLKSSSYNITHLTFLNVGSHGNGEKSSVLYTTRLNKARKVANDLKYDLVEISSNIDEILQMNFVSTHTFRSFSAVLALQKLFKTYYYASGYPIDEFKVSKDSAAYYDLLSTMYLSTENTSFYSAGIELTRLDKVNLISEFPPSYNELNVCVREEENCGECEKCIRTQLELYALGKLELYKNVFDIYKFKNNKDKYIGFMLRNNKISYYNEIIARFSENKYTFNIKAYFYCLYFYLKDSLKKIVRD